MVHVDDHGRANTARADGDTPRYTPSVHPLPVEIIRVILRLAAATSSATEALQWLSLCRASYSWIAPILYANVFIRSVYHLHLFHDALARYPIRGHWVKALWIAGGKQTPNTDPSTRARSLSISTVSARTSTRMGRSAWTRNPPFPVLSHATARDPTFDLVHILQNCPTLRHLALVGCSLLASALQVAAYPFRLCTLLLDPPICLKFSCMKHVSTLQILRIVGIPEENMESWRGDWWDEVRSLQRLRTLELVVEAANEKRVISIDKRAINKEPTPLPATTLRVTGDTHRETKCPSKVSANTAPGMASGTYRDNDFYEQWTIDRAEETAALCLDF